MRDMIPAGLIDSVFEIFYGKVGCSESLVTSKVNVCMCLELCFILENISILYLLTSFIFEKQPNIHLLNNQEIKKLTLTYRKTSKSQDVHLEKKITS